MWCFVLHWLVISPIYGKYMNREDSLVETFIVVQSEEIITKKMSFPIVGNLSSEKQEVFLYIQTSGKCKPE